MVVRFLQIGAISAVLISCNVIALPNSGPVHGMTPQQRAMFSGCTVVQDLECELPKHADEVNAGSVGECCAACTNQTWCKFWSFKASDVVNGIACRRFNSAPLRNKSSSEFVSGTPGPTPAPAPSTVRLRVNGSQLLTPSGQALRLVGFNWPLEHVHPGDGALMKQHLPSVNVARIVGVLWDNSGAKTDCYSDTAPYFRDECFVDLDAAVKAATDAGVWVILTARCAYAAGQFYDTNPGSDVFHNTTLRNMLYTMWTHVASHYASWAYIAAYEVMAEPRDKLATPAAVRSFYDGACGSVATVDPVTPCMVGPGPYYKLWNFTVDHVKLNRSNVIYTFDYFVPEAWTFGEPEIPTYPGVYNCTTLYTSVWADVCCPSGPNASMSFDASWNTANFDKWAIPVKNANVPVFLNQWSVVHGVPAQAGRYQYMSDVAKSLQAAGVGWAWWVWRGGGDGWSHGSSELVYQWDNGTLEFDTAGFAALEPYTL